MRFLESRPSHHSSARSRKRRSPAHLVGLAVLGLSLLLIATDALAGDLWWVGGGIDDRWDTHGNWVRGGHPHAVVVPDADESTYITTSEHAGLESLPRALVDHTMVGAVQGRAAQLYVGGWQSSFDPAHGDATLHGGELEIAGGELVVDNYTRLGTGGAEGTINQSGGTLDTALAIVLGWLHPESLGTYNLSGGDVIARFIDIGRQGTGVLNMTGGHVHSHPNTSSVGQGYTGSDGVYIPGHGFLNVGGGTFEASALWVGRFEGSTGEISVEGDGNLRVWGAALVGAGSAGSIRQSGGTIEVGRRLILGQHARGQGLYRLDGGTLRGLDGGLHVGLRGTGRLEIRGSAGEIDIAGNYQQNGESVLSATLDASHDHITTIRVGGTARFAPGAMLRVERTRGFRPSVGDTFVLLTADQGILDYGLRIVGRQRDRWILDTSTGKDVTIVYRGPGRGWGKGGRPRGD